MAFVRASTFVLLLASLPTNAATSQNIAACENEDQGECTVEKVVDDEIAMIQVKLQTESLDNNHKVADQKDGDKKLSNEDSSLDTLENEDSSLDTLEEEGQRAVCYVADGYGYPNCGGSYITNSQEDSLEACSNRCTANWQCKYFAFPTQGWGARNCGLYKTSCSEGRAKSGEYSTYRKAGVQYQQKGYGYPSCGYISNSNEDSLGACQNKCSQDSRCKYVAFNTNAGWTGGTCGLYSEDSQNCGRDKNYCAGRDQCDSYCASTGCAWTAQYSCPWAPEGTKGRADADGSTGYNCCCEKRNAWKQQCGGTPAATGSSECYQTYEKTCR